MEKLDLDFFKGDELEDNSNISGGLEPCYTEVRYKNCTSSGPPCWEPDDTVYMVPDPDTVA
jgi:hypothetical protein